MTDTLASRFVIDPNAMAFDSPYNGTQTYGVDDNAEIEFPDGSVACCVHGRWRTGRLPLEITRL